MSATPTSPNEVGCFTQKRSHVNVSGFNKDVWHALWIFFPIFLVVYAWCFFSLKKGAFYLFDPRHGIDTRQADAGDYSAHYQRYMDMAKLCITLSAASIAFLINSLLNEKPDSASMVHKIANTAPIVVGFFGLTIATLILFMVFQTVFYEAYSHSPDHNTYSRSKYALCNSLDWTGLLLFVIGFGWLAQNLF